MHVNVTSAVCHGETFYCGTTGVSAGISIRLSMQVPVSGARYEQESIALSMQRRQMIIRPVVQKVGGHRTLVHS